MASRVLVMLASLFLAVGCAEIKALLDTSPPPRVPVRQTPSPATARPAPPPTLPEAPAPRLSPLVDADRETRLTEETHAAILGVERTLFSIDRQKLKVNQSETYQTVQSFLAQARKALTDKDFQQAVNLANKARVLSDELSRAAH